MSTGSPMVAPRPAGALRASANLAQTRLLLSTSPMRARSPNAPPHAAAPAHASPINSTRKETMLGRGFGGVEARATTSAVVNDRLIARVSDEWFWSDADGHSAAGHSSSTTCKASRQAEAEGAAGGRRTAAAPGRLRFASHAGCMAGASARSPRAALRERVAGPSPAGRMDQQQKESAAFCGRLLMLCRGFEHRYVSGSPP